MTLSGPKAPKTPALATRQHPAYWVMEMLFWSFDDARTAARDEADARGRSVPVRATWRIVTGGAYQECLRIACEVEPTPTVLRRLS